MNKRNFILAGAIMALSHSGYAANPASTDWVNMRIAQLSSEINTMINQLAARIDSLKPITYTLCEQAQGGVIVSLNAQGTHGLVVSTRNLADNNDNELFVRLEVNANDPNYYRNNNDGHNNFFNWRYPNLYELGVAMQAPCSNVTFNYDFPYWASNISMYPTPGKFFGIKIDDDPPPPPVVLIKRDTSTENQTKWYVRLVRSF